jgi:LysM repeat protein
LGCPGKPARKQTPHRLPKAAAPTLFGVAAALSLSAVTAGPAGAQTTAHHAAAVGAVHPAGASPANLLASPANLLAATQPAKKAEKGTSGASLPAAYTVRSGDSLSAIAGRYYHNPDAWPVLFWANHSHIRWANEIQAGEVLNIPVKPAKIPAAPGQLGPAPAPAPAPAAPSGPASNTTASYAPAQAAPAAEAAPVQAAPAASSYSGGAPGGSFGQCVIARESGGNAQVMNSSGHYGLYQFSASTWAAYGGSPGSFGNASVAQQNQVFANAIAQGGQSNWSAYDGC